MGLATQGITRTRASRPHTRSGLGTRSVCACACAPEPPAALWCSKSAPKAYLPGMFADTMSDKRRAAQANTCHPSRTSALPSGSKTQKVPTRARSRSSWAWTPLDRPRNTTAPPAPTSDFPTARPAIQPIAPPTADCPGPRHPTGRPPTHIAARQPSRPPDRPNPSPTLGCSAPSNVVSPPPRPCAAGRLVEVVASAVPQIPLERSHACPERRPTPRRVPPHILHRSGLRRPHGLWRDKGLWRTRWAAMIQRAAATPWTVASPMDCHGCRDPIGCGEPVDGGPQGSAGPRAVVTPQAGAIPWAATISCAAATPCAAAITWGSGALPAA